MQINTMTDVLRYILEQYEISILLDGTRCMAIIADLAPTMKQEKRLMKLAFDSHFVKILVNANSGNDSDKQLACSQFYNKLVNATYLNEVAALQICTYFTEAMDWKVDFSRIETKKTFELELHKSSIVSELINSISIIESTLDSSTFTSPISINQKEEKKKQKTNKVKWLFLAFACMCLIVCLSIYVFSEVLISQEHKNTFISAVYNDAYEESDSEKNLINHEQAVQSEIFCTEVSTEQSTEASTLPVTEMTTTQPSIQKTFRVIADACSWVEAKKKCEQAGGHLAYITCQEDFDAIIKEAKDSGLYYLWLGGITEIDGNTVKASWLNGENLSFVEEGALWYPGEPSGRDYSSEEIPLESYVMLWYVNDK